MTAAPTDREIAERIVEDYFGPEEDGQWAWVKIRGTNMPDDITAALSARRAAAVTALLAASRRLSSAPTIEATAQALAEQLSAATGGRAAVGALADASALLDGTAGTTITT